MTSINWEKLRDVKIAGYRLTDLICRSEDRAAFHAQRDVATAEDRATGLHPLPSVGVRAVNDAADAENIANRFREALFFSNKNLIQVYDAGVVQHGGMTLVYYVTERFSYALGEASVAELSDTQILHTLAPSLIEGLRFLHREGFVYCALNRKSVWRVGEEWKLADFGDLMISGNHSPLDTRRMLIRADLISPPEAYQGIVSPAWDAWSLGSLLHELLGRRSERSDDERRTGKMPLVSPAYNYLISELLDPDPTQRLTLGALQDRLAGLEPGIEMPRRVPAPVSAVASSLSPAPNAPPASASVEPKSFAVPSYVGLPVRAPDSPAPSRRLIKGGVIALIAGALFTLVVSHKAGKREGDPQSPPGPNPEVVATPEPTSRKPAVDGTLGRPRANSGTENDGEIRKAVLAVLRQWVESTRARDIDQHVQCYAPVVDRYFGRANVTRDDLRRDKRAVFERIGTVRDFSLTNVRFKSVAPRSVVVVADKSWNFPERHFAGVAHEELTLRELRNEWKIASERELRARSGYNSDARQPRSVGTGMPAPVTEDPVSIIAGARP